MRRYHSAHMRLLVGTLHAEENELEECLAAIASQTYREFDSFVLSGLAEKEAHDALYGTFMDRAAEFDLFLKIDADMVVTRPGLFGEIAAKMEGLDADQLAIGVLDYFSGLLLLGLHVFRSHVRWPMSADRVFPDRRGAVSRERRIRDLDDLAPAAVHCKDPGPFQSFRFGLHRGVKLVELQQRGMRPSRSPDVRERTWERFRSLDDIRRGWASLGFELAISGRAGPENRDYADPVARSLWEEHRALDSGELVALIESLRRENSWLQCAFEGQSTGTSSPPARIVRPPE